MPVDPQIKTVLAEMSMDDVGDLDALEPAVLRELLDAMPAPPGEPVEVAAVANTEIPGPDTPLALRTYTPEGEGPFPLMVYFHGGGFCICNLDTHDATCRTLCRDAGCVVVSVDYRLAPEAKWPAAPEDCYAATEWAVTNAEILRADPERLVVAGDSAGGNLAAVVALMARDRSGPQIAHQLLVYPVINHDFDTVSYREFANGYLLTRDMMMWFWGHYLADPGDGMEPLASPIQATSLADLPAATIVTAEFDPLRDEGEAYARRLTEAEVPTRSIRFDGLIHGFLAFDGVADRAREAVAETVGMLREALEEKAPS